MGEDIKKKLKLSLYESETEFREVQSQLDTLKSRQHGSKKSAIHILNDALLFYTNNIANVEKEHPILDQTCSKPQSEEPILMTTMSAIRNLCTILSNHNSDCQHLVKLELFEQKCCNRTYNICCDVCVFKSNWKAAHDLPSGHDLINLRVRHAFLTSGMLPSQLERFSESTGIGNIGKNKMQDYIKEYSTHITEERKSTCERALSDEISKSDTSDSVDIITDARHSTRTKSKYTDVVCIGHKSHKALKHVVVSRDVDPCAQRHELLGTKEIYAHFDNKIVKVRRHGHDRNASVNKYIRESRKDTTNQNDTWHVSVSISKEMKKISSGAKYKEGNTWSYELQDKVQPVKTHISYSMRNCEGDSSKLRDGLNNIVSHYQNDHTNCNSESRCKLDPNYKPSTMVLTESVVVKLLQNTIQSIDVYKHPENYVHHTDTFFVESFNNVLNIFQDKKIGTFGQVHYQMRSDMAICHWNENVSKDRITYSYRTNIWNRWMNSLFSKTVWRPF